MWINPSDPKIRQILIMTEQKEMNSNNHGMIYKILY